MLHIPKIMDYHHLNSELRVCWVADEPYDKVKAFWDALGNTPNGTRTGMRNKPTGIIRVCDPTYKWMKKVGWMNLAQLDDDEQNTIPPDARSILNVVRAHAISNGGSTSRQASLQMVLNPYVHNEGYDYLWVMLQAVPSCVPYVVLRKFNVIFNHFAFARNYFSDAHITRITEESLRLINCRYMCPPNGNSTSPAPRTRLDDINQS